MKDPCEKCSNFIAQYGDKIWCKLNGIVGQEEGDDGCRDYTEADSLCSRCEHMIHIYGSEVWCDMDIMFQFLVRSACKEYKPLRVGDMHDV